MPLIGNVGARIMPICRSHHSSFPVHNSQKNESIQHDSMMPRTPVQGGRRHVRQACEPCRAYKRKCDGQLPCNVCLRYEFDCTYSAARRKDSTSVQTPVPTSDRRSREQSLVREATSGVRFVTRFAAQTDPADEFKLQPRAWNLGLRGNVASLLQDDENLIAKSTARQFSSLFIQKVHPLYSFVDTTSLDQCLNEPDPKFGRQLPIVYGTVAIGSLFSAETLDGALEMTLVESCRARLHGSYLTGQLELEDLSGWILYILYLRLTGQALSAWMTSCTAVHIIQALGLHDETKWPKALNNAESKTKELYRRQFWVAYLLHRWIAFEYGRPSIDLGETVQLPKTKQMPIFQEKLDFYHLSVCLSPQAPTLECQEYENNLEKVFALQPGHDELIFDQVMLSMCFYRHVRLKSLARAEIYVKEMIQVAKKGLAACSRLLSEQEPWWHVVNVPFQLLCIFLLMDTNESLAAVPATLETLKAVAQYFPSDETRQTEQTAIILTRLVQRLKAADAATLDAVLSGREILSDHETALDLPTSMVDVNRLLWDEMSGNVFFDPSFDYLAAI